MVYKILIVYLVGILLCQPVYIWAVRTLCRMEDEDEELYCQDNGMYYEPRKPNYPLLIVFSVPGRNLLAIGDSVCGVCSADFRIDG